MLYADISDHLPVCLITSMAVDCIQKPPFIMKRETKEANINRFLNEINAHDWNNELNYECDSPSELFSKIHHIFCTPYEQCCPLKRVKTNSIKYPRKPWLTSGLVTIMSS